jgi:hypothetical protein
MSGDKNIIFMIGDEEIARIMPGPTIRVNPKMTVEGAGQLAAYTFWESFRNTLAFLIINDGKGIDEEGIVLGDDDA